MFGINLAAKQLQRLEAVLDRQVPIKSLAALHKAVDSKIQESAKLETSAIGIDSSVFLKLAAHKHRADIVDYLNTKHTGPLILPGQAVQEFWNNQLSAVETVSASIKKKFDALKQDAGKVDPNFGDYAQQFESLLSSFSSEYGHIYDAKTLRSTSSILEFLQRKAELSYIPRTRFALIAETRKKTKTPPGFMDLGDGDFFVWAEFLYGLLLAKDRGNHFDHAIILTNDQKIDWSRSGVAHPVLAAEVHALVGVPFDVWTIEELYRAVAKDASIATAEEVPAPTEGGN